MADEYKEITTTSWGKRITDSFMGIIFGVLFFIGSFPLIFWNEGRSVDRIRTLDEGRSLVVAVSSDKIDPAHSAALIHISGNAVTDETLDDSLFGVRENALKLKRTAEMYQWKETKHTKTEQNMGGSETTETTYSYEKTWSEDPIDSSDFKKREGHENPSSMPYSSKVFSASTISVGAFKLSTPFIEQINAFEPYPLSEKNFEAMDESIRESYALKGNRYFYGDAENPKVGAVRISYEIVKPSQISVVGKQEGDSVQAYYTKNGEINLLEMGNVGAESMFATAASENAVITWLVRLGAFVLMWVGLAMVFGPIKVLGDVVPFIGSLFGAGIGLVTGVISLVLSFTAIAIAWIVFRPVIGIILLAVAGAFFFGGFRLIRKKIAGA